MTDSLYSRLGGYDGIAMFATTLVGPGAKGRSPQPFLGQSW